MHSVGGHSHRCQVEKTTESLNWYIEAEDVLLEHVGGSEVQWERVCVCERKRQSERESVRENGVGAREEMRRQEDIPSWHGYITSSLSVNPVGR